MQDWAILPHVVLWEGKSSTGAKWWHFGSAAIEKLHRKQKWCEGVRLCLVSLGRDGNKLVEGRQLLLFTTWCFISIKLVGRNQYAPTVQSYPQTVSPLSYSLSSYKRSRMEQLQLTTFLPLLLMSKWTSDDHAYTHLFVLDFHMTQSSQLGERDKLALVGISPGMESIWRKWFSLEYHLTWTRKPWVWISCPSTNPWTLWGWEFFNKWHTWAQLCIDMKK